MAISPARSTANFNNISPVKISQDSYRDQQLLQTQKRHFDLSDPCVVQQIIVETEPNLEDSSNEMSLSLSGLKGERLSMIKVEEESTPIQQEGRVYRYELATNETFWNQYSRDNQLINTQRLHQTYHKD